MKEPSQAELDALPADRRLELLRLEQQRQDSERERRRQSRHQWFNSIGILLGVLFTAGGLVATAITVRVGWEQLRRAQQGQITDRYTKAVEQLGSSKRDVRTGAVYALERIAVDSPRDRITIRDVLATFVREHGLAPPTAKYLPVAPDADVQAALTVLARRPADPEMTPSLDLHAIRTPGCQLPDAQLTDLTLLDASLRSANLTRANLTSANLTHANLSGANLADAHMADAIMVRATLTGANLTDADLTDADLTRANLPNADLTRARLVDVDLSRANLPRASLGGADLTRANLTDANLTHAEFPGADLADATLIRADLIRANLAGAILTRVNLADANLAGADLGSADLTDVVWSDETRWPDSVGSAQGMRARSEEFRKGIYRVRT